MEIYFDNAATTRLSARAAARMERVAREHYGNASSLHLAGLRAEEELKTAAEEIAKTLKAEPRELIFTSGGTESDNLAILGTARSRKGYGRHLITSAVEHPAVLETMRFLEEQGFRLTVLPVDASGKISLSELEAAIRKDTVLVSLMYVNNEIGAIQPIAEAAALVHRLNPDCYFHVDAVQAYGKFEIYPKRLGIDMMSVSSHKIEGPKGVGFLYVNRRVSLKPVSFGGGQQGGLRSGTLNVPGIAGMAEAARAAYEDFEEKRERLLRVKDRILAGAAELPGVRANSAPGMDSAPQIVSLSVEGVRAEVLLHALEAEGVYVSSGSACSSNHPGISATLKGIGLPAKLLDSTVRLSFSAENTEEEAERFLELFRQTVPKLRQFKR